MKSSDAISVVIPTKDRVKEILKCVDSILKQSTPVQEIIIIDSSKNAGLHSLLKEKFSHALAKIRYIHSKVSNNAARNIGIRQSAGDIVFFFDDDVILDENYVEEVVNVFGSDEEGKIAGVMGNITNMKRDVYSWRAVLRRLFSQDYYGDGKFRLSGLPTLVHGKKRIMRTEFLSGCMMAFRRDVLRRFRFDERLGKLGGYCFLDDVDFSYRVSRKHVLMYTPSAKLKHRSPIVISPERKRQYVFNYFYLFKKNVPKRLPNILAFLVSLFGLLISTGVFERDLKGAIGCLQGIRDVTSNSP